MSLPDELFEDDDLEDEEDVVEPSLTYDIDSGKTIDNIDAMVQAVKKIVRTEYDSSEYYLEDYGIILEDLIGASSSVVEGILPERITEALMQDDRIEGVEDFIITVDGDKMYCEFTVVTIYGEVGGDLDVTVE